MSVFVTFKSVSEVSFSQTINTEYFCFAPFLVVMRVNWSVLEVQSMSVSVVHLQFSTVCSLKFRL